MNPRAPDCFQRTPRRVNIVEGSNDSILSIATDGQGNYNFKGLALCMRLLLLLVMHFND